MERSRTVFACVCALCEPEQESSPACMVGRHGQVAEVRRASLPCEQWGRQAVRLLEEDRKEQAAGAGAGDIYFKLPLGAG